MDLQECISVGLHRAVFVGHDYIHITDLSGPDRILLREEPRLYWAISGAETASASLSTRVIASNCLQCSRLIFDLKYCPAPLHFFLPKLLPLSRSSTRAALEKTSTTAQFPSQPFQAQLAIPLLPRQGPLIGLMPGWLTG